MAGKGSASVHTIARVAVALVFFWHGLVPKLLLRADDESRMLTDLGFSRPRAETLVTLGGLVEFAWGVLLLWLGRRFRWPWLATIAVMILFTVGVAWFSPRYFALPFNPLTLNLGVVALSWIALLTAGDGAKK